MMHVLMMYMLITEAHLYEYVEADVEVSTVDKLVGEKSPNLFLLGRVEDQGTLLEENSYHIENYFVLSANKLILFVGMF